MRTEPSALSSKALLFEPTSPMLRVGALKGEHHDALEEFSQLEPLVAGLGACAGGHAVVGVGGLVRVVHLVRALEDVDDARHRELGRVEPNIDGERLQLREQRAS